LCAIVVARDRKSPDIRHCDEVEPGSFEMFESSVMLEPMVDVIDAMDGMIFLSLGGLSICFM
jgi:hypothetical protein